ncbi:hypothetical protein WR25_02963 [Diploscapter pachys]|uniref:LITAF domain-containing protein n=1 Tax=Diploscapter pachys TaxID=2018661 RepID=A0A2A2K3J6_9BILA|nr:hypothetical protein WR25_02963 [Diploscapter pachys]
MGTESAPPPPTYEQAQGAPTAPPPVAQPVIVNPPTVVYTVHQQPQPQTVIVMNSVKEAPSFNPYVEYCPRCQTTVTTVVRHVMGFCSWLMLCLGIFVFFPLLCCFCLSSFQDSQHYCPNCGCILSIKKR